MVLMEVPESVMREMFIQAAKYFGSQGGRKCNPRKGFGTGDNARKAVAVRWAKYRESKKNQGAK